MIKTNFIVLFFVFSCFVTLAHDEYKRICEQQKGYEQEKQKYENAPFGKWPPGVPTFKIKDYDSKIQECKTRRKLIEKNHNIRIKRIFISDIPDVDLGKPGHADITVFRDKNLILGPVYSDGNIEFHCNLVIKRGDVFEIMDKDPSGYDPIGKIVFSRIIHEILSREGTKGEYRGQFQTPYNYCKFKLDFQVEKRR